MLTANDAPDPVPPACRAAVERIQRALDGESGGGGGLGALDALDGDPHPAACAACRARVRAARLLLSALAAPPEPGAVPDGFTDRVLAAVAADRRADRFAGRSGFTARVAGWAALAAAIVVGMFYLAARQHPAETHDPRPIETARPPEVAPAPRERPAPPDPAPVAPPVRFGDGFAKVGRALLDAPKPLADSVAVAPKIFDAVTTPFRAPGAPANPMDAAFEPTRESLGRLPDAARAGLEPVAETAQKAFNRFLRDFGAVRPNS
jgi:hypothetical protein